MVHIACTAHSFVLNEYSKGSAFFLMFQMDEYMSIMQLLNQKIRYIGGSKSLLGLDALRDIYALALHNIKLARE